MGPIVCELSVTSVRINPAIADSSSASHHRPPIANKAIVPQIAAHSPNDSSSTKISASPRLSHKTALRCDRTDGDGATATLQQSDGQALAGPILLSIPSSGENEH